MSGALTVRELEHVRGGAALVISLGGMKRLSGRRCTDRGNKRRWTGPDIYSGSTEDEELQFWMSPAQIMLDDEKMSCLCIPENRGSTVVNWRYNDLASHPSSFTVEDLVHRSVFTSLAASISQCPKETQWTRLILNIRDIFTSVINNIDLETQENSITMDRPNRFIIIWDKDTPSPLCIQDCSTCIENVCLHISDNNNVLCDLTSSTVHSPSDDNNNSEDHHHEMALGENLNVRTRKGLLKSCHSYNQPGEACGRDRSGNMRKSVSFDDDVTVYLFDQESPTMELRPEPCTSLPGGSSCSLPEATLEDSGLEWDDDFSALEGSSHAQRLSRSQHCSLSLPTRSWTDLSRPQRYLLPQSCLFLTSVAESDLEP